MIRETPRQISVLIVYIFIILLKHINRDKNLVKIIKFFVHISSNSLYQIVPYFSTWRFNLQRIKNLAQIFKSPYRYLIWFKKLPVAETFSYVDQIRIKWRFEKKMKYKFKFKEKQNFNYQMLVLDYVSQIHFANLASRTTRDRSDSTCMNVC